MISQSEPVKVNLFLCWEVVEKGGMYLAINSKEGKEGKGIYRQRIRIGVLKDKRSKMQLNRMELKEIWRIGNQVLWMLLMLALVLMVLFCLSGKGGELSR
ncbi:MAG: hypothetical protein N3A69_12910 [Leptospiraceae bacterium]|nr:hypothetical protein [Leptospiraceae bacterium]